MWWKLFLLTLYLGVLFMLSRLLETMAYYEGGYLASRLLDPVSLSVRKLKLLLDQRGVSYAGVVEKHELTDLIEQSGDVLEGELEVATNTEPITSTSTNFTGALHFNEEVEDTKDSVWLVKVKALQRADFLPPDDWLKLTQSLQTFGVRTGVFDCTQEYELCEKKGWYSSRLLLAVPQGFRVKDKVMLRHYTGSNRIQSIFNWVNTNLASRMNSIKSWQNLQQGWFSFPQFQYLTSDSANKSQSNEPSVAIESNTYNASSASQLCVLFFSQLPIPPMFLSVLSVKFTGRVKFGTVSGKSGTGRDIADRLKLSKLPHYLVMTPDRNYSFGHKKGEYCNYKSMSLFLKTLHPEVNDIFLLSLIAVNVMCWFEFFIARGTLFKRLGNLMWCVGKWNFLLILLWVPILGLYKLPIMHGALENALRGLQTLALTQFGRDLRSDWLWYLSDTAFLPCTFLMFASCVGFLHYIYQGEQATDTNNNVSSWWQFDWESCMSALFRPVASLTRPMARNDDLEVGMEMLIERLAVPDLWLRPMISSEYIQDLPLWKYSGPCIDSDIGSDVQSDGEGGYLSDADSVCSASSDGSRRAPAHFRCDRCRALSEALEQQHKSDEELEEERRENESACAKYLMDGDYKCMCCTRSSHTSRRKSSNRSLRERRVQNLDSCEDMTEMPEGMLASTECAICLESYRQGALLCGLPCAHAFHQSCILGWLHRDNHACPVCRWPSYKAKPCSLHAHID